MFDAIIEKLNLITNGNLIFPKSGSCIMILSKDINHELFSDEDIALLKSELFAVGYKLSFAPIKTERLVTHNYDTMQDDVEIVPVKVKLSNGDLVDSQDTYFINKATDVVEKANDFFNK